MAETFFGALEEGFLRAVQNLCAGIFKFFQQIGARLLEQPLLFLESGTFGAEAGIFLARGIKLLRQPVRPRGAFPQRRHLDPRLAQLGNGALEFILLLGKLPLCIGQPGPQIGQRARSKKPAKRGSENEGNDRENRGVHHITLHGTYRER